MYSPYRIMVKFFIIMLLAQASLAEAYAPMTEHEIATFREIFIKTSGKSLKHCTGEPIFSVTNKHEYGLTIFDYYEIPAVNVNKFCVASSSMTDEIIENKNCQASDGLNDCWLHETLQINAEYMSDFKLSSKNYLNLIIVENGDGENYDDDDTYIGKGFANIDNEKLAFLSKLASIPLIDIVNKHNALVTEFDYDVEVLKPHGRLKEMTKAEKENAFKKNNRNKSARFDDLDVIDYVNTNPVDYATRYFYFFDRPDPDFNDYVPSIMGPSWSNSSLANDLVSSDYFIRYRLKKNMDIFRYGCDREVPYLGITMPNGQNKKYKLTIAAQWRCI